MYRCFRYIYEIFAISDSTSRENYCQIRRHLQDDFCFRKSITPNDKYGNVPKDYNILSQFVREFIDFMIYDF